MVNNANELKESCSSPVVFTRVGIRDFRFCMFVFKFKGHSNFLVPGNNPILNQVSNEKVYQTNGHLLAQLLDETNVLKKNSLRHLVTEINVLATK